MKTNAKKLLLATAVSAVLVSGALINQARAADNADVDASVETRTAIAVVKDDDMEFGLLDVTIATQAATIVLSPTADSVSGGSATVVTSGTAQSGQVTITTDGASDIDVTCDTTATLENGAGDTLTVSAITIEATAGATFASAACTGAAQAITPTAADVVLGVGGSLVLAAGGNEVKAGSFLGATDNYNTVGRTAAAIPVNIQAVYQ